MNSFTPNEFSGSDIEKINAALSAAGKCGGTVRIPPRQQGTRACWLIDSAILIPGNVQLILDNCTIKLSDRCRDNMIRSANCGPECGTVPPLENLHITGVGNAVLEGASIPRSTGDGAKTLYTPAFHPEGRLSFGSDANSPSEHPKGDWRNIGILLANVRDFAIENITIRNSHCWAVSLEYCRRGRVRDMNFYSEGTTVINGTPVNTLNQDGLDLRNGCRDILIENICGATGDDLVALTAIGGTVRPAGILESTMMMGGCSDKREEDIFNITIRNVRGHSAGGHQIVRFLNSRGVKMYNILLDGLTDTSTPDCRNRAAVRIGDSNKAWGGVTPLGETYGFQIRNIHSFSKAALLIAGSLQDSVIDGIINFNPQTAPVTFESGKEYVKNLLINNLLNAEGEIFLKE